MLAAGCQAAPTLAPTFTTVPQGTFTSYVTRTSTPTTVLLPSKLPVTNTPLSTITATPRTYVVKAGDDMSGIALRFRVPLKDLTAANPTVNPRLMKVGTVLIIPGTAPVSGPSATDSPTPQPVTVEPPVCRADPAGGAWCFALVRNQGSSALINVTVQLRLVDAAGKEIARQNAALPLDLLPAGKALPLAGFFAPPLPAGFQAGVQLVSALPANAAGERYPQLDLGSPVINIAKDGFSAQVSGRAVAAGSPGDTAQYSVLAVAYSNSGSVVGMRRWDSAKPVPAGQTAEFSIQLYSLAEPIQRVELFGEARK